MLHFVINTILFGTFFCQFVEVKQAYASPSSRGAIAFALKTNKTDLNKLEQIIDGVQSKIKENKNEYLEVVRNIEEDAAKYKGFALPTATQASHLSDNLPDSLVLREALGEYEKIKSATQGIASKDGLRVFVSFSMSKSQLEELDTIAHKIGAKLLMRGLKDNSFKETLNYIREIKKEGIIVDIDPKSFEKYGVNLVPTFVLNEGVKYDKLTGNVTIKHVLESFAKDGAVAEKAKLYLGKFSDENN